MQQWRTEWRTKVTFGKTMMRSLELLWLTKGTSLDEAMLKSEEIKPVALAAIELRLSEGISQSVSQSAENSIFSLISHHIGGRV